MDNVVGGVPNGKKSPIIAALLSSGVESSTSSMSTSMSTMLSGANNVNNVSNVDRVVDEEVSKLINNPAGPGQQDHYQHQFALPTPYPLASSVVGHQYSQGFGPAFPIRVSSSSSNSTAKSPAGINRNLAFDFISIDRSSGSGHGHDQVPSSPTLPNFGQYNSTSSSSTSTSTSTSGSRSMSLKLFQDSPAASSNSLSPLLRRRFTTPSPSGSSVASTTSNSGGQGSFKRYSRRRHAKKYPAFEVDTCKYKGHYCPEPLASGTIYCIKHQNCIPYNVNLKNNNNHNNSTSSSSTNMMYERCSFRDLATGKHCTNFRSSKDSRTHDRLLFCQSHADRLAKVREEQKRFKLGPLHIHQLIDELRENIDLSNDDKILKELVHMPGGSGDGGDFLKWWKENEDWIKCAEASIAQESSRFVKAGERSLNEIGKFQTEPGDDEPDQGCSDGYDVLRNAGFYTTEEIIQIHRSKVVQIQDALQKQSELEKILFKEKKRQYLIKMHELKDPTLGFHYTSNPRRLDKKTVKSSFFAQQMESLKKKKIMLRYGKKSGAQRVLFTRAKLLYCAKLKEKEEKERYEKEFNSNSTSKINAEIDVENDDSDETANLMELTRRMKSPVFELPAGTPGGSHGGHGHGGGPSKSHQANMSCILNLGYHKKCGHPVIPTTKYCPKHTFSDLNQKLFKGCSKIVNVEDGDKCGIPILMVEESKMCPLHRAPKYNEPSTESREQAKERLKKEATIPEATGKDEERAVLGLALAEQPVEGSFLQLLDKILEKGVEAVDEPQSSSSEDDDSDGEVDDEIQIVQIVQNRKNKVGQK